MKVGDKVKGFRFENNKWSESMSPYIGVEGTVKRILNDSQGFLHYFQIEFYSGRMGRYNVEYWYPIKEYIVIQRDEKLKELGI